MDRDIGRDGAKGRGGDRVFSHGLDDDVALVVCAAAAVLRGPLDRQLGADHVLEVIRLVILVAAVAIATLGVVLRVHETVVVVAVASALVLTHSRGRRLRYAVSSRV